MGTFSGELLLENNSILGLGLLGGRVSGEEYSCGDLRGQTLPQLLAPFPTFDGMERGRK